MKGNEKREERREEEKNKQRSEEYTYKKESSKTRATIEFKMCHKLTKIQCAKNIKVTSLNQVKVRFCDRLQF